jgi:hypothetical protein
MVAKILLDILAERDYQDEMWGQAFDNNNTINDWVSYITRYCGRATCMDADTENQREAMVKVAALAVAALEAFDRNGKFAPRHYENLVKKD